METRDSNATDASSTEQPKVLDPADGLQGKGSNTKDTKESNSKSTSEINEKDKISSESAASEDKPTKLEFCNRQFSNPPQTNGSKVFQLILVCFSVHLIYACFSHIVVVCFSSNPLRLASLQSRPGAAWAQSRLRSSLIKCEKSLKDTREEKKTRDPLQWNILGGS